MLLPGEPVLLSNGICSCRCRCGLLCWGGPQCRCCLRGHHGSTRGYLSGRQPILQGRVGGRLPGKRCLAR